MESQVAGKLITHLEKAEDTGGVKMEQAVNLYDSVKNI